MTLGQLTLKTYPDPCLRIRTKPVEQFSAEIGDILRDMTDLMYISQGIGLAATQVGVGLNLLVVDAGEGLIKLTNPEILDRSKEKSQFEEGCLSLPGVTVNIKRSKTIKIRAWDENGEIFIKKLEGLTATAIQHEMDHLNGKLIIDYLDPIRRFIVGRKLSLKRYSKKTCEVVCHERD
ncbi:MAG: peptide deformylase [Candidatus Omnitrophota bacterium]